MYKNIMRSAVPLSAFRGVVPTPVLQLDPVERTWEALRHLEATYPGFRSWFFGKVVPGLSTGERRIFYKIDRVGLNGVVIAKRGAEQKLSTIWTAEHARGQRVAGELVAEAFDWLENHKPLLTIPQERLGEFVPLLRQWDFRQTEVLTGLYRPGKTEHVFNGVLRSDILS